MDNRDLVQRIERLSPAKRALLNLELEQQNLSLDRPLAIPRRPARVHAPLSFAQRRMWFLHQLEPDNPCYNESSALRLKGRLDSAALQTALGRIVERHEALRATVLAQDGVPVLTIQAPQPVVLATTDLRGTAAVDREAQARHRLLEAVRRPFNLAGDLLLRALLIRLDEQEHLLLVVTHHIASDAWSANILWRELADFYQSERLGVASRVGALPIQYQDYAAWQQQWLSGAQCQGQLAYWKRQLDGLSTLRLPTDRPALAERHWRAGRVIVPIDKNLTDSVSALSRAHGVTQFMTLLAAFQVLLHRYSGQDDIAVGTPISGRNRTEVEGLVGFFVNTLILRGNLAGDPTFSELLGRVRDVALDAYNHQDIPFEKLVEELNPQRSMSQTPLFNVLFAEQNLRRPAPRLAGLTQSPYEISNGAAKCDLYLAVVNHGQGLALRAIYDLDLFDGATIERLLGHYQNLLRALIDDPTQPIDSAPLITAAEQRQLLVDWNASQANYPRDCSIGQLFERQVEQTPDTIALISAEGSLTYRELNHRANRLARYLQAQGSGARARVAICMHRSVEAIVAMLAILKAGGTYLPMDPSYPLERLRFMVDDGQTKLVLTNQESLTVANQLKAQVIAVDLAAPGIALGSTDNLEIVSSGADAAYLIYTSGSTGAPKGVEVTHRGVARLLFGVDYVKLDSQQTLVNFAPLSFDAATFEIWGALLHGAQCVVAPPTSLSVHELAALLTRHQVTTLWLTASLFNLYVDQAPETLRGVKQLLIGGEALSVAHVRKALDLLPDTHIVNGYGPTEGTTFTCCYPIPRKLEAGITSIPIGKPIANTQVYVLDKYLQPVPVGAVGELHIGGDGLAKGYLNRPELTAEKFIANPFSDDPASRLYKTGDLARYRADGNLEFIGRSDDQVKIRGFRIEPGEIESVLLEHPAVQQAVVLTRGEQPGDRRLVAYTVQSDGAAASVSELRGFLQQKLPSYMIPAAFVDLPALPLSANGKLDRSRLPVPDRGRPDLDGSITAPRTPVEEMLVDIWHSLLKLDRIGIHDNFFHLGGHSLLATQVISRVNRAFQTDLPLRSLFESPTIAGLADCLRPTPSAGQVTRTVPPIVPRPSRDDGPLSFAQERLWFLNQLDPGDETYTVPSAFRLSGALNVNALERSLSEIVRRHEALRTVIATSNSGPRQTILPAAAISLTPMDLSQDAENQRELKLQSRLKEARKTPFDLSRGPLIRAHLWRIAPRDHVFALNLHHIVSDGWSLNVLFREISALYRADDSWQANRLTELPIQYADYALWQREWLQGDHFGNQLAYWRKQLDGLATLELPTDRPRPPAQTSRGATQAIELPAPLWDALKRLCRDQETTLFMTLLAAFQVLLFRHCGQSDIAVGTPIAGRTRQETEGLIGFFVNTLVLRGNLANNPTFKELLAQARETTLEAYDHQDIPFEKLVETLNPERKPNLTPLFQVLFAYQDCGRPSLRLDGLDTTLVRTINDVAKFDLSLKVAENDGRMNAALNYKTDLFDTSTIGRMLGHFQTLLEGIASHPDQRISELPLLSENEKRQLLIQCNDTASDYPRDQCIHQRFEAQAEKTPHAIALVYEDRQMSYRELNQRANQLAHYLNKRGVVPGMVVGICLERSFASIVGLLAILKAGAAYLPLDPSDPDERLRAMIADSQTPTVITVKELSDRAPLRQSPTICLDRDLDEISQQPTENLVSHVSADDLAYLIYTSGSTGQPKGVEVLHRGVVRLLFGVDYVTLDSGQRFLQLAPMTFDAASFEIWGALLHGARCVLYPGKVPSTDELAKVLKTNQVTTLWLTASLFNSVIDQQPAALSEIGQLLIGGEALSVAHVRKALDLLPDTQIINGYGPTEGTTFTCCYPIPRKLEAGITSIPIGKPIANTQVYVLDKYLHPVPMGAVGELYIGGDGLAQGYLNRPELTKEKFIANPFNEEPGARLYKTGDLARYRADDNLEFIGRLDDQVKIRGFRIEPGEIESVLLQHPAVQQAVVLAREEQPGDRRLVAYTVQPDGAAPSVSELRGFLQQKLPSYMIPAAFVNLPALPLSANGKLDRHALPAVETNPATHPELPPQTAKQQLVWEVWREVLSAPPRSVDDNFFELGGHSLLAIELVARLGELFQREIPLRWLFESPTVAGLAARLETEERSDAHQPANRWRYLFQLKPGKDKPPVFLLPGGHGDDVVYLTYAELAFHVGNGFPFYGLRARSADGTQAAHPCVEAMAADYLREIRELQPQGPYLLVGNCVGGVIAYEIARQLQAQGEASKLILMDTFPPTRRVYYRYLLKEYGRRFDRFLRDRRKVFMNWLRAASHATKPAATKPKRGRSRQIQYRKEEYVRTLRRYRPQPYQGRVSLFYNQNAYAKDPLGGWSGMISGAIESHCALAARGRSPIFTKR